MSPDLLGPQAPCVAGFLSQPWGHARSLANGVGAGARSARGSCSPHARVSEAQREARRALSRARSRAQANARNSEHLHRNSSSASAREHGENTIPTPTPYRGPFPFVTTK